ncbi:MAG: PLDc N-terminal domain-containing protein [Mycobacteriales bacterium]|nr:PLDc N-terminal domain-containing protein [Mycobacteriales bacterium]
MLYGYGFLFVVELCMVVYCALNVITTPESEIRNLPKLLWLLLVLVFPIVGGIAWLVAGRPQRAGSTRMPYKGNRGVPAEYDRPGRAVSQNPDDDEAFLKGLRDRAESQRRQAEERAKRIRDDESGGGAGLTT